MDKNHFILRKRYKVILKDEKEVPVDLKPEEEWFFENQEKDYLIVSLRKMNINVNEIKEIVAYFTPEETEKSVKVVIGL